MRSWVGVDPRLLLSTVLWVQAYHLSLSIHSLSVLPLLAVSESLSLGNHLALHTTQGGIRYIAYYDQGGPIPHFHRVLRRSITTLQSRSLICMGEKMIGDLPMRSKVRHRWILIHLARRLRLEPKNGSVDPTLQIRSFWPEMPPKNGRPPKKTHDQMCVLSDADSGHQ